MVNLLNSAGEPLVSNPPREDSHQSGIRLIAHKLPCEKFVTARMHEAHALKLYLVDPTWQRALKNYMFIAYHAGQGGVYAMPMAHYQQIVAFIDETLFDRHYHDEPVSCRQRRLAITAKYLSHAARGSLTGSRLTMRGAYHAQNAAAAIRRLRNRHRLSSDERILAGWARSLVALFEASVEEYRGWSCKRPADCSCHKDTLLQRRTQKALRIAPKSIRAEIEAPTVFAGELEEACTTILLRLCSTAASIGAGGLFWAAALRETGIITDEMVEALHRAATLLDYVVRLDNDLSDASRLSQGDRDGKMNCVTIVFGESASAAQRRKAILASQLCRVWLNGLFETALQRLLDCWRELGQCMARGAAIGESVYNSYGHFKDLSSEQMAEVTYALDKRWR